MCLITRMNYRHVAKENLTVYKLLLDDGYARYRICYTYVEGENVPTETVPLPKPDKDGFMKIEGGWLHAFTTREKAEDEFNLLASFSSPETVDRTRIVEMVIPEGTEYFLSVNDDEVCAKKLVWYGND